MLPCPALPCPGAGSNPATPYSGFVQHTPVPSLGPRVRAGPLLQRSPIPSLLWPKAPGARIPLHNHAPPPWLPLMESWCSQAVVVKETGLFRSSHKAFQQAALPGEGSLAALCVLPALPLVPGPGMGWPWHIPATAAWPCHRARRGHRTLQQDPSLILGGVELLGGAGGEKRRPSWLQTAGWLPQGSVPLPEAVPVPASPCPGLLQGW